MALRILTRGLVVVLLGTLLILPGAGVASQATAEQDAGHPFADLGLPQLELTLTDTAFEGLPAELEAGRYVVALTVETSNVFFVGGGAFMQIPAGMTAAEFLTWAAPQSATPMGDAMEDVASEVPPSWYYETRIAGGPYAEPGHTGYAVVELTSGEWVFWAEYPGAPQAPVPITVSGELPADAAAPQADVTIEMTEFTFDISSPLTGGTQIVEMVNVGTQPHFFSMIGVPAGTTVEDFLSLVGSVNTMATPMTTPVDGVTFEEVGAVIGVADQSAGVTAWYAFDLEPGTYAASCTVIDPETGSPHAMLGMVEIIEVE